MMQWLLLRLLGDMRNRQNLILREKEVCSTGSAPTDCEALGSEKRGVGYGSSPIGHACVLQFCNDMSTPHIVYHVISLSDADMVIR